MNVPFVNYNLDDVPTVKRFIRSNKKFKLIVGPVGCVPGNTKVLTPEGWINIEDWDGQEIAQYIPDNDSLEFVKPVSFIKNPADLWHVFTYSIATNPLHSVKFSPEHRVLFTTDLGNKYVLTATNVHHQITKSPPLCYLRAVTSFSPPLSTNKRFSYEEMRVIGWLYCYAPIVSYRREGNNHYITYRNDSWNDRHSLIRYYLHSANIDYEISKGRLNNRPATTISFELPLPNIRELYNLSAEYLHGFFTAFREWCYFKHGYDVRYIIPKNNELLDFLSYLASLNRYVIRVLSDNPVKYNKTENEYILSMIDLSKFHPPTITHTWKEVPKDGEFKYCFIVPSSYFLIKVGTLVMATGNSGKSSGCVFHLFKTMVEQEPDANGVRRTRYAVIRNTMKMLHDTTKKTIDDWLPSSLYTWKEAKALYQFKFALDDGTVVESEWLMRALDNPDQVRDLLSLELSGAWINEAREVSYDIFKLLRSRIGRFPAAKDGGVTYAYIIMDTNPCDTEHWLYKLFEEQAKEDQKVASLFEVFRQPSGLSPMAENINNLPERYYEDLAIGQDEDFIRVYIHGEYGHVREGKPVFSNYSDQVHLAKEPLAPIRGVPLTIGMDFGLYPAAVITQITPKGRLYVLDECYTLETMDIENFVVYMLMPLLNSQKYMGWDKLIIGDPAGSARSQLDSRTCFSVLRELGFQRVYPAYTNSLQERLRAVNQYLTKIVEGEPAFLLSPTCEWLRQALLSKYHFKRIRAHGERYAEVPDKNEASHIADALQYACLGYKPAFRTERPLVLNQRQRRARFDGFI